jgi:hypothetical protein
MNRSKFNNPETIEGLSRPILNFDGLLKNSLGMLRQAQHERKNINYSKLLAVRPELRRRVNGVFQQPVELGTLNC